METITYSYTENYEDVNAPAYPDSRFVHIFTSSIHAVYTYAHFFIPSWQNA